MTETLNKKYPKIGVNVFVFNEKGELLMGKRIGKTGYGTWCLPGGHFEWGEKLEGCAKRELEEETGIVGEKFEYLHMVNDPRDDVHYVHIDFIAKKWHGVPTVTEPDKFAEWKWFDMNNLPENIFVGHQELIPAFINNINFIDGNI
ncbi:MAG: NUDIX domain-containing protein [bacterium]